MVHRSLAAALLAAAVLSGGAPALGEPLDAATAPPLPPVASPAPRLVLRAEAPESARQLRQRARDRRLVATGLVLPGLAALVSGILLEATRPPECESCFIDGDLLVRDAIALTAVTVGASLTIAGLVLVRTATGLDEQADRSRRDSVTPFVAPTPRGAVAGVRVALR